MRGGKITPEPPEERPPGRVDPAASPMRGPPYAAAKEGGTAGRTASSLRRSTDAGSDGGTTCTARCPPRSTCPPSSTRSSSFWQDDEVFARSLEQTAGRPAVGVLRGPAHRQRQARHPPRRGPGLQGRLPPLQDHEGLPRRPQGRLGLPRPAGRARRREGARLRRQAGHRGVRHRRVQRPLPRVGAPARRRVRAS